ncbi:MAG: ABC transporter substrate-binding protein [Bacilli bacterium]|nr:ABC transporter substrate-binding protein [Bacilli bacterium]
MKVKKAMLAVVLGTIAAAALTSCGKKTEVGGDNTIQIRVYKAGYGITWLEKMIEKYEAAFPDKKVKIEEASANMPTKAKQEIMTPKTNQIDLYFTSNADLQTLIGKSQSVLRTDKKVLLEELSSILDSKAIGSDGREESQTIRERLFAGYEDSSTYQGLVEKWRGNVYKLPWADAVTGLFMNRSILEKYNIEVPLTSNELINAIKTIKTHTAADGIYPYSWAGGNASGYWSYLYETWFAQYSSATSFNNFMKCQPESGTIRDKGYQVYEDVGIKKSLEAMVELLDFDYSPDGSAQLDHMEAQDDFLSGKSAFMVDGDWLLNEMKGQDFDKAKNVEMLRTPILSSIGTDNGLTEEQLHNLVKAIDEKKDESEIKAIVPAATDQVIAKVKEARSIHDCLGASHDLIIPEYADAKEAAKHFVRFMYSNEGCRLFRNNAYANLPLKYDVQEGDTNTNFQKSIDNVYDFEKVNMITGEGCPNDIRAASSMRLFNVPTWVHPTTFYTIMLDKAEDKKLNADYIFTKEKEYMTSNWSTYMSFIY